MKPILALLAGGVAGLATLSAQSADCVILLHGLARTSGSMKKLETAFEERGFDTQNINYPSRHHTVEELAPIAVEPGISACPQDATIHFVTHSLGGIVLRYYLENHEIDRLGRVVMLAPPNRGSEVVDTYRKVPGFRLLNGPAGLQLGTDDNSILSRMGPVTFELGVIAGTHTFNPILSQSLANPDDGKVSVEKTKIEGMTDFVTVPHSHPFIMRAPIVIEQALAFIEGGQFVAEPL